MVSPTTTDSGSALLLTSSTGALVTGVTVGSVESPVPGSSLFSLISPSAVTTAWLESDVPTSNGKAIFT